MPYRSSGSANSGVIPVLDQNRKAPDGAGAQVGDPVSTPDFIVQAQQKLADIRNQLSDLMASRYGDIALPSMASKALVGSIRKQAENELKRDQLEEEESAIVAMLNNYLYAGTLGDYDTQAESDVGGEETD